MKLEKFRTSTEFNALLKTAKDDRERCILLLLAGVGQRVGEMTQIRAEDIDFIDFSKGTYSSRHQCKVQEVRTVVLLSQVAKAIRKATLRTFLRARCSRSLLKDISLCVKCKILSMTLPPLRGAFWCSWHAYYTGCQGTFWHRVKHHCIRHSFTSLTKGSGLTHLLLYSLGTALGTFSPGPPLG